VALIDAHDFAQGTSSKATKLLHGGVRYLAQGNLSLVREALRERTALMRNAPHLASPVPFVMPAYRLWERPFYGLGLRLYDALAGSASIAPTASLGRLGTLEALPTLRPQGLLGGVRFWDGQFDDARLALAIGRTAARHGAVLLNHVEVTGLLHEQGRVVGADGIDRIGGAAVQIRAGCIVNATGVWVDRLRTLDATGAAALRVPPVEAPGTSHPPADVADRTLPSPPTQLVRPSQGVHLVLDREMLPGGHALLVPHTSDGRVLFAVPWLGKTVLGTTDTATGSMALEPRPLREEIDFLLGESARYLTRAPVRADVRSVWVGLRPLVASEPGQRAGATRRISREHTVLCSPSGMVTVTGGKWTTCRAMAEDVLECCAQAGLLDPRPAGATRTLPLVGAPRLSDPVQLQSAGAPAREHDLPGCDTATHTIAEAPGVHLYGDEADMLAELPGAAHALAPGLTEAMVRFAARFEYALTVGDMLARRSRLLFLDAQLAARVAPEVAAILQQETGEDPQLASFLSLSQQYLDLP
jgi:glycerol-3-phosphate dehydrogenase